MKEQGTVIALGDDGEMTVEVARSTSCENCRDHCMLSKDLLTMSAQVENPFSNVIGDRVTVELTNGNLLVAALIMYGIPFIVFMFGLLLGGRLFASYVGGVGDALSLLVGIVLLTITFLVLRTLDRKGVFKKSFSMKIVK
jgi:sigma-E factor negative regulatory protein RseC